MYNCVFSNTNDNRTVTSSLGIYCSIFLSLNCNYNYLKFCLQINTDDNGST